MKTFKNRKANNLNRRRIVIDLESIERNSDGLITAFEAEIIRDDDVLVEGTKLEANEFSQVLGSVVSAYHGTAEEKGEFELESLVLPEVIEPNYELETKGILGSVIEWSVLSNSLAITIQNNKVIYNKTLTSKEFTLKAFIDCEGEVLEKEFEVKTEIMNDKDVVNYDFNHLTLPSRIYSNITLPIIGEYYSEISWGLSTDVDHEEDVALNDGYNLQVTRKNENYFITLMAFIRKGAETKKKIFLIEVMNKSIKPTYNFADLVWIQNKTKLKEDNIVVSFNNVDNIYTEVNNQYEDKIIIETTSGLTSTVKVKETQYLNNMTYPTNSEYNFVIKVYLKEGNYYIGEIPFSVTYIISSTSPED